jgi:hypothetical protein
VPKQAPDETVALGAAIASIMQAIQEAKRLADLETSRMAQEYARTETLSSFPVPAFTITEVELELRFAVDRVTSIRGKNPQELHIHLSSSALKDIDPQHLQVLKFRISPASFLVTPVEQG